MSQDDLFDFIIVGAGGGSVPAALVLKDRGQRPLIIEKQSVIGGTSAYSGGIIWIPNNHHLNEAGGGDSHERSRTYFDSLIGDVGPASSAARRDSYIRNGAEMVRFLESKGMKFYHASWPDYYDSAPGGSAMGRSLACPMFDLNELGDWADKIARHAQLSGAPIDSPQFAVISKGPKRWPGRILGAKVAARMLINKLTGRKLTGLGMALMGRLFQIVLRERIPIWTDTSVTDLLTENGRVVGVVAKRNGRTLEVRSRLGVLVNAGGFARNLEMRNKYQPKPTSVDWTQVNPVDMGDMIEAGAKAGAALDLMDEAWWLPSSFTPQGEFMGFHSPNDIGKPHCIVVDAKGQRFGNESCSYMEFGKRMYDAGAVPAWAIFDSTHRRNYLWGLHMLPGITPKKLIDQGYLLKARSLDELAGQAGIDPEGLAKTVARFNGFAKRGVDEDFGRGESQFNKHWGDPTVKPNACLGALDRPPYYAVKLLPGDVGTSGGILTDEFARALRADGTVIEGLYATGNSTASVMGRNYLGAGASVGPSMVFGYAAARHAVGANA